MTYNQLAWQKELAQRNDPAANLCAPRKPRNREILNSRPWSSLCREVFANCLPLSDVGIAQLHKGWKVGAKGKQKPKNLKGAL